MVGMLTTSLCTAQGPGHSWQHSTCPRPPQAATTDSRDRVWCFAYTVCCAYKHGEVEHALQCRSDRSQSAKTAFQPANAKHKAHTPYTRFALGRASMLLPRTHDVRSTGGSNTLNRPALPAAQERRRPCSSNQMPQYDVRTETLVSRMRQRVRERQSCCGVLWRRCGESHAERELASKLRLCSLYTLLWRHIAVQQASHIVINALGATRRTFKPFDSNLSNGHAGLLSTSSVAAYPAELLSDKGCAWCIVSDCNLEHIPSSRAQ